MSVAISSGDGHGFRSGNEQIRLLFLVAALIPNPRDAEQVEPSCTNFYTTPTDVCLGGGLRRPQRPPLGSARPRSLAETVSGKERLFDPTVVDGCVALFREDGFTFG
jgi:hypothetical protein